MHETITEAHIYITCDTVVLVLGKIGNIFVIVSILRQKNLLKSNYYFFVLQLALNDFAVLFIYLLVNFITLGLGKSLDGNSNTFLVLYDVALLFQVAGIGMMLIISVLRYRATVLPLKPPISRRRLKVISCFVYVIGLIAGFGLAVPLTITHGKDSDMAKFYKIFHYGYVIQYFYILPTLFMAILYYKICRELIQQNERLKAVCPNAVTKSSSAIFSIRAYIRNRRTAIVCVSTVLWYGVSNIPMSVCLVWVIADQHHFLENYVWVEHFANIFRVVGSHAINPAIYGILDRKLISFWKLCFRRITTTQRN